MTKRYKEGYNMFEVIKGPIYEHKQTKKLLQYLPKKSIVYLWHEDLDGVAVNGLIQAKVKAVINAKTSMSGKYAQRHVRTLLQAGIAVFDIISIFNRDSPYNGEQAFIYQNGLFVEKDGETECVAELLSYDDHVIKRKESLAITNYPNQFEDFVKNTLHYAGQECDWFKEKPVLPIPLNRLRGETVFIVARNTDYEKDIKALYHTLKRKQSIVIAVDGAADGLMKYRICPDFIVGDMDSISEKTLNCGATLICHQHPNGRSPGKDRLMKMGIEAELIRFVGTSEDVALTAAFWSDARKLFLIGCRTGMTEFLEKGRAGMGATWLARMQAGDRITDLKGIHQLYSNHALPAFGLSRFEKPSIISMIQTFFQGRIPSWKKKEVL